MGIFIIINLFIQMYIFPFINHLSEVYIFFAVNQLFLFKIYGYIVYSKLLIFNIVDILILMVYLCNVYIFKLLNRFSDMDAFQIATHFNFIDILAENNSMSSFVYNITYGSFEVGVYIFCSNPF